MTETERVKVVCHQCKEQSITQLLWGEDGKYPEDFELECPKCDNWESGQLPTQSFDILDR